MRGGWCRALGATLKLDHEVNCEGMMKLWKLTEREILLWYVAVAVLIYTLYRSYLLKVMADGSNPNSYLQFLCLTVMIFCPLISSLHSSWRKQMPIPAPAAVILMGCMINLLYLSQ